MVPVVHGLWVWSGCVPVDLLALLKWKAHPDRVMDILGRLRHVSGEEIVKVSRAGLVGPRAMPRVVCSLC